MNGSLLEATFPPEGPLAISTNSLWKRFGRKTALRGLNISVPHGSVYVLVGPNGAGKTTTLRILMDLIVADRGSAEIFGLDSHRDAARVRAQIGYLPERQSVPYGRLTIDELFRYHSGYFPAWDHEYAGELTDLFTVDREARLKDLSKGEQRRVQIVMTLAHRPPLLLLDEPTDGLDPVAREKALSAMAAHLARFPTTMLLSTHQVHEAERLGNYLGVLHEGELAAQLGRGVLRERLLRYRIRPAGNHEGSLSTDHTILHQEEFGQESAWTVWGDRDEISGGLRAAGFTVVEVETLTLAESALALLGAPTSGAFASSGGHGSERPPRSDDPLSGSHDRSLITPDGSAR